MPRTRRPSSRQPSANGLLPSAELPLFDDCEDAASPALPVIGEAEAWAGARGFRLVAGVDEAGRGPLAGPVVAACVALDPDRDPPAGINDSKLLDPAEREALDAEIRARALAFGIAAVGPDVIDQVNILQATLQAMAEALAQLTAVQPDIVLVDGISAFPCTRPLKCLVRGDQRSLNIAAASILAKVQRDREMVRQDGLYPGYGFSRHKGYATPEHLDALARLGPCPIHRRSFNKVLA